MIMVINSADLPLMRIIPNKIMCICAYFHYRELCCPIIGWLCPVVFRHGVVHRLCTGCGYVVDNLVDKLWVFSVDNLWETKSIGVSWRVGMSGPDRILGP